MCGLPPNEYLLMIILANRCDKNWQCFPSQAWLAERTGLSLRTVKRAMQELEKAGHISRKKRSSAAGRTSDLIKLNRQPKVPE